MSVGMPVLFWKPHFLLYWRRLVKECIPIFGFYTFLFAILMIILRLHFFEVFGSFQTSCGIFFILFPFLSVLILVLLSAHISRFSISRLWNFSSLHGSQFATLSLPDLVVAYPDRLGRILKLPLSVLAFRQFQNI